MALATMLEAVTTLGRSSLLHLCIRYKTSKAKRFRIRMREDKRNFGPLLETSKERNDRQKTDKSTEKPEVPARYLKDHGNAAELSWIMGTTNAKNLRVLRVSNKNKTISPESVSEKLPQLFGSSNSNDISKLPVTTKNDETKMHEGPFSSTTIVKKGVLAGFQDKSCYGSIIETCLDSAENDASHYPITNALKHEDKWSNQEIMSFSPADNNNIYLPGVTRVLNQTMSEEAKLALERWKKKMTLELGVEGFDLHCKKLLEDSKTMHSLIEKTLKEEEMPDIPQHLRASFESMQLVLKDVSDVRMLESHVVHPSLGYRGIIDCVASYRGNLCIIDWKKSEKIKDLSTTYDSPLQVSAYIGALNADPNYPFQVKSGVLAIAYTQGQPPSIFEFSEAQLEFYWREWLKRLEKYKSAHKR